jgi:hypothetical protein
MIAAASSPILADDVTVNLSAGVEANAGSNDFAPHYISANRHGTLTQANGGSLHLKAIRPMDQSRRFSWGFGLEAWGGAANSTDYLRYYAANQTWANHSESPANVWLQQAYAEVKYRGVFLTAGLKEHGSPLLNQRLSSGDLVQSGNSRPIPEVRAGFIDFQNIPLTNGWVQIQGEIGYGKVTDNGWQKSHYSFYNYHLNLGSWYNYKRCFFRTNPSKPFSVTLGMQAAAQFAGITTYYQEGLVSRIDDSSFKLKDIVDMLVIKQGDDYWKGNHIGSWDFNARYRLRSGHELKAYFQWLWEDGSGIGKLNGWDGLWGVEWKAPKPAPISGAVVEFMSYMNQSGPMHYDYDDIPGTTLTGSRAEGADNYYNNTWYNGYANYGMAIGSPMFISPIYNTDGYTAAFTENRFWGFHLGVSGEPTANLSYRLLASYRRFYGMAYVPDVNTTHDVSAMLEAAWAVPSVDGLKLTAQVAFDAGNSTLGDRFGALVGVSYSGLFNFNKKKFTPCTL